MICGTKMNVCEKFKKLPKIPAITVASVVLFAALGTLWVSSERVDPVEGSASGSDRVSSLAPVPPAANFVDRSQVPTMTVEGISGQVDSDISMLGGTASIEGKVVTSSNRGAAQRPTVELSRWEGNRFNTIRISTDNEGKFKVDGLKGGRWSGRAWQPPTFASSEAAAWFIAEGENLVTELALGEEAQRRETISVSPADTTFDSFSVLATITDQEVNEGGRLVDIPFDGVAQISWPSNYEGSDVGIFVDGELELVGQCILLDPILPLPREGEVKVGETTLTFTAPLCVTGPEPTTTTTTTPTTTPSTTTTTTPTTTTTVPSTTTTTTVQPPLSDSSTTSGVRNG